MANRRMISKSISYSKQVNSLGNEFTQLLFTWAIPHLDDFGKIEGDAKVFKAIVMPMSDKSEEEFEKAINEMIQAGLVDRYEVDGESYMEFLGFENHQTGLNKRTKSKYPDNPKNAEKRMEFPEKTSINEENRKENNQIELTANRIETNNLADKNSSKSYQGIKAEDFFPTSEGEHAAYEVWKQLEPKNPRALFTTYLYGYRKGVPPHLFHQWCSEIKQDSNVRIPGAVFMKKIILFLSEQDKK